MEGNLRFKIDWATLIVGSNLLFLLCFTLYLEGRFNGGFLRYRFGGLIFGGAYTWRGLLSEFYDILVRGITHVLKEIVQTKINPAVPFLFGLGSLVWRQHDVFNNNILLLSLWIGMAYNFEKRPNFDSKGTEYDYDSIMHYGKLAFSKSRRPTIKPKDRDVSMVW